MNLIGVRELSDQYCSTLKLALGWVLKLASGWMCHLKAQYWVVSRSMVAKLYSAGAGVASWTGVVY